MTHMSFDLGGAFGAGIAGALIGVGADQVTGLIATSEFVPVFTVAAALVLAAAVLYQLFFRGLEVRQRTTAPAVEETTTRL